MTIAILKKADIPANDDLVVIPRREYNELKDKASAAVSFPVVRLRGNAARKLDRRVVVALREYRQGRTKVLHSLRDLM